MSPDAPEPASASPAEGILAEKRQFEQQNPSIGECANSICLNRGVHPTVLCPICAHTLHFCRFLHLWHNEKSVSY
jgi:hypothetical protein